MIPRKRSNQRSFNMVYVKPSRDIHPLNPKNAKNVAFASERCPRSHIFSLSGIPIPLQRARFVNGHAWDCQKQEKLKSELELLKQFNKEPIYTGYLQVDLTFYMPMAKRMSIENQILKEGKPHNYRPDVDNLAKYVLDICNKIIFDDDASVSTLIARKVYSISPRTEFIITELLP